MNAPEGTWHWPILAALAQSGVYVEIGIRGAHTYNYVAPFAVESHGVDVNLEAADYMRCGTFWHMTSDEFFDRYEGSEPDLIFIDGDHSEEQVEKDFANAKRLSPNGTIAFHDSWPAAPDDELTTATAWRVVEKAEKEPGLFTFRRWPGLSLYQAPRERFT